MSSITSPNQVPISITFHIDQVELVVNGLGKLPYEQVADLISGIRNTTLNQLQAARAELQRLTTEQPGIEGAQG